MKCFMLLALKGTRSWQPALIQHLPIATEILVFARSCPTPLGVHCCYRG